MPFQLWDYADRLDSIAPQFDLTCIA